MIFLFFVVVFAYRLRVGSREDGKDVETFTCLFLDDEVSYGRCTVRIPYRSFTLFFLCVAVRTRTVLHKQTCSNYE